MSDKAKVQFTDRNGNFSPIVYFHNHGPQTMDFIRAALPYMRRGQPEQCCAAFIGVAHRETNGEGVHVYSPTQYERPRPSAETLDWGVFLVDVDDGAIIHYGGIAPECLPTDVQKVRVTGNEAVYQLKSLIVDMDMRI